jgi:hypothetical protein
MQIRMNLKGDFEDSVKELIETGCATNRAAAVRLVFSHYLCCRGKSSKKA